LKFEIWNIKSTPWKKMCEKCYRFIIEKQIHQIDWIKVWDPQKDDGSSLQIFGYVNLHSRRSCKSISRLKPRGHIVSSLELYYEANRILSRKNSRKKNSWKKIIGRRLLGKWLFPLKISSIEVAQKNSEGLIWSTLTCVPNFNSKY
jgi:hypothetical protein